MEHWTAAHEIFQQGLVPPVPIPQALPPQAPREEFNNEDNRAATKILGYLIKRLMGTTEPRNRPIRMTKENLVVEDVYDGISNDSITPRKAFDLGCRFLSQPESSKAGAAW